MRKGFKKYGNKKPTLDGEKFDSLKEMRYWVYLKGLERDGKIKNVTRSPRFKFPINGENVRYVESKREISYTADFEYFTLDGQRVIVDAKGMKLRDYKIRRALMFACHGIFVEEV
jgi:hypothetical protein